MPRKPNYQYEKRQKELDRKSRKEEKLRRRRERTAEPDGPEPSGAEQPTDVDGVDEPTSDS